jgi:hypothetical protein
MVNMLKFWLKIPMPMPFAKEQKAEIKEAFDLFATAGTGTIEVSLDEATGITRWKGLYIWTGEKA